MTGLVLLAFALVMAAAFAGFARQGAKAFLEGELGFRNIVSVVLFGPASLLVLVQLFYHTAHVMELRALESDDVRFLIGQAQIEDGTVREDIADCLSDATWFHGRRGRHVPFRIIYDDGTERRWRIAPKGDGGVVDFSDGGPGLYRGAAYVECLPDVLERHGMSLADGTE